MFDTYYARARGVTALSPFSSLPLPAAAPMQASVSRQKAERHANF